MFSIKSVDYTLCLIEMLLDSGMLPEKASIPYEDLCSRITDVDCGFSLEPEIDVEIIEAELKVFYDVYIKEARKNILKTY